MADKKTITRQEAFEYYSAYDHFFPEGQRPNDTPYGKWPTLKVFSDDVAEKTGVDIHSGDKRAILTSQQNLEKLVKEGEDTTVPKNLETLEEDAAKVEAGRQKTIKAAAESVDRMVETQQKIHDRLAAEKEKVSLFVKATPPAPLEETKEIKAFKEQAQTAPKEFYDQTVAAIEKSITPSLQNQLTPAQIHLIAQDAAYKGIDAVNNPQKYIRMAQDAAILKAIAEDKNVLPKIYKEADIIAGIQTAALETGTFQDIQTFTPRAVFSAFDEKLAKSLFPNPAEFEVTLSQSEIAGYTNTFNPDGLAQGYARLLIDQSTWFAKLAGIPVDKVQAEIIKKAGGWLEGQIVSNFPSTAAFFSSSEAATILGGLGIGAPISLELPALMSQFIIETPGALPLLNFAGGFSGVSFGIGSAAGASTAGAVAAGGAELAGAAATAGLEGAAAGGAAALATGPAVVITGPLLVVAGAVVGKAVKNTVSKIKTFLKENGLSEVAVAIPIALITGLTLGIPLGIGAFFVTFGVLTFMGGGSLALRAALSGFGSGIGTFFGVLWGTFLAGIGTPILITLIGIPVVVAFILFIINSGALVVPPGISLLNSTNPYIDVTKVAAPSGTLPSPTSVTYTVTITAKKDALTRVVFKSDCAVVKKNKSQVGCPAEDIPVAPTTIAPGTPFSFTFTSNYDNRYIDSLVTDSLTVTADVPDAKSVSETGTASICFGDCPLNCFAFPPDKWPKEASNFQSNLTAAAARLAGQFPNFAAKVCGKGTINLCYTTSNPSPVGGGGLCNGATYARHFHSSCDITFNQCGLRNTNDALFLLTHEATHHIQKTDGQWAKSFLQQVPRSEWPLCTYNLTGGDSDESMAEGDALFVGKPSWNGCLTNYASQYPKHYLFAKNCMFAPAGDPACKTK